MIARLLLLACWLAAVAVSQTTQGLIAGRLLDARTGRPIAGARIACSEASTGTQTDAISDDQGYYALPLTPPGQYSIRATAAAYQSQEAQELELAVAGRLDVNFRLRPLNDVWEAGLYRSVFLSGLKTIVTFYGPDVDSSHSGTFEGLRGEQGALESTVSEVIDPLELENLPLAGRDVYALLFTLPAVTSDGGVSRGLGLSVNGQRPSSSNYLLDGVENNNYLVTGPLTPLAPEAIQEYRISTSSFSAQYGRTSGFIANAVTKSGAAQWHGVGYFYFRNEALDANNFQRNLQGLARARNREFRPGFQMGGPLLRDRLFVSAALERFTGRGREDPQTYLLPTPALVTALPSGSIAQQLLTRYPTPVQGSGTCRLIDRSGCIAQVNLEPPISLNQWLGLLRLDYISPGGAHHLTGRASVARLTRPDFLWSPYPDFVSPFHQTSVGSVLSHQYAITPRWTNEARVAYSTNQVGWGGAGLPTIQVFLPNGLLQLPGSSPVYPFKNNSGTTELLDNAVWTGGRHVVTAGAGVLLRHLSGFYSPQSNGVYNFLDLTSLGNGTPFQMLTTIDRRSLTNPTVPSYNSEYVNRQYFLFAQDAFRVTSRLLLNYGLRYEYFGAPHSIGAKRDPVLELGPGSNLIERLRTARLNFNGGPAGLLYQPDPSNLAVRFGFSYNARGAGKTLLHGAYGIFHDRLFDNLWETARTNNIDFAQTIFGGVTRVDFTKTPGEVLPSFRSTTLTTSVPNLTLFEPNLRNGYAQDIFIGVQQRLTESLILDINGMSSLGRRLITNDTLGRGTPPLYNGSQPGIPAGQLVTYRGSQGLSDYYALTIKARYRRGRGFLQAAYTWSHAIDNQSDPLGLDLSDFGFSSARVLPPVRASLVAGFAQPMNSRGDRGNSDFDERHNFNVVSTFDLPSFGKDRVLSNLSRGWTISEVGALRSGFPYTVWALTTTGTYARANIIDPALTRADHEPVPGGARLLNPVGFSTRIGTPSGRNAFTGPGMVNLDVGLSRWFSIRESLRLAFRADVFNVLNHANLNNPFPVLGDRLGVATFGRTGRPTGFPTALPLAESPRQIQLSVRLRF